MKRNNAGSYYWPEPAEVHIHPHTDFVGTLSEPSLGEYKRMVVWHFNSEELESISIQKSWKAFRREIC